MKVQHIAQPKQTPWGYQVEVTYVNDMGLAYTQACCFREKPDQKQLDVDVAKVLADLTKAEDAVIETKLAPVKIELAAVSSDRDRVVAEKIAVEAQLAEAIAVKEEPVDVKVVPRG